MGTIPRLFAALVLVSALATAGELQDRSDHRPEPRIEGEDAKPTQAPDAQRLHIMEHQFEEMAALARQSEQDARAQEQARAERAEAAHEAGMKRLRNDPEFMRLNSRLFWINTKKKILRAQIDEIDGPAPTVEHRLQTLPQKTPLLEQIHALDQDMYEISKTIDGLIKKHMSDTLVK